MNCEQFENSLPDALGGELSADQRAEFDKHVRVCERCRREFESTSAALSAIRSLPAPPVEAMAIGRDRFVTEAEFAPRTSGGPILQLHPLLRYAAVIAIAFVAGYVVRAGLTPSISSREVVPGSAVESRPGVDAPEFPRITERFASAHSGSFEAAFAGAHLKNPSGSDLAKCMVAMFSNRR